MKHYSVIKLIIILLLVSFASMVCTAQNPGVSVKNPDKILNRNAPKTKSVNEKRAKNINRSKKKQEANKKKLKKEYADFVKKNRSHALVIQTPEVRARMKENRKDADLKYQAKRKKVSHGFRKAARKHN